MNEDEDRTFSGMEARSKIWQRIEATAMQHHSLQRKRGLYKKISIDALRSNQTVSDWKTCRSPVPLPIIERLAQAYGVSPSYLLCLTDRPEVNTAIYHETLSQRMSDIVNNVLGRVSCTVPASSVVAMCQIALMGLMLNKDETTIYGELFMHAMSLEESSEEAS